MSYYATINGTLNVQKGKTKDLLEFVEKNDDFDFELWDWENDKVGLNYYDNFCDYDFLEQINKLIPYLDLSQEQLLEARGEDGSNWRYVVVDGQFKEQDGKVVYGDKFTKEKKTFYITYEEQGNTVAVVKIVGAEDENEAYSRAAEALTKKYDSFCDTTKPEGLEFGQFINEDGYDLDPDTEE